MRSTMRSICGPVCRLRGRHCAAATLLVQAATPPVSWVAPKGLPGGGRTAGANCLIRRLFTVCLTVNSLASRYLSRPYSSPFFKKLFPVVLRGGEFADDSTAFKPFPDRDRRCGSGSFLSHAVACADWCEKVSIFHRALHDEIRESFEAHVTQMRQAITSRPPEFGSMHH